MSNRNAEFSSQQHRKKIGGASRTAKAVDFFNLLTGPELLEMTDSLLPEHRERLYPPTVALSMFMMQALSEDRSCQRAVAAWAAQRRAEGLTVRSVNTGAYCKARQRLPVEMVSALSGQMGQLLHKGTPEGWRWRGRCVKLVDGTGISMPDTPENQARYPQPTTQAAGVGFPLMRLIGVVCLASGAVLEVAFGPHAGKGTSELGLLRSLPAAFSPGDVMLADALYANYFLIATLQAAGVDVLFEQHGARITDFRRGEQLGARDHRVKWPKPARPEWMSQQTYDGFADHMTIREVKVRGKVLVTTMLDAGEVPKTELAELYTSRWNVELDFRNIKTTLGMNNLSCQTPDMNEKELSVYFLAYNVIRLLMAQAAANAAVRPRQLSFKLTVQLYTEWMARQLCGRCSDSIAVLFTLIAQVRVGNRPGRIEPRARKRRPKPYEWLKESRRRARHRIKTKGHGRKLK